MQLQQEFIPIALSDLHRHAAERKQGGWRFVQTHAVSTDEGVDLYYSFMKDGKVDNLKISGVTKDDQVPSITYLFLAAFVFENEARELFGVDMRDIAIDFGGALYAPAESEPMTFISPTQKAAREKARKAQAAKSEKTAESSDAQAATAPASGKRVFVMTPERRARLDAKLATMAPEKVAKVEAAIKEREAEAAAAAQGATATAPAEQNASAKEQDAQKSVATGEAAHASARVPEPAVDHVLESKIALLDKDKAAKVRAALAARRGGSVELLDESCDKAQSAIDADLEAKLALMDEDKALKVRAALKAKAASKGGE